ncbi:MAG: hypothetical protein QMD25_07000 [Caldisericia bacterium]|jgi:hypothetical protein|nr:hypothetical protein [Caldisericia bacterium]
MNWKLFSHETIENLFLKNEKFKRDSKLLIIDPSDYVPLFDISEEIEDGKILVLTNLIKDFNLKVKEFGFNKTLFPITKKAFYKIKKEILDAIIWVSPDLRKKDIFEDLSLTYKFLKNDGKLYLLFDKEMKLLEEFKIKLLHKADINETIGILEKIGFKKTFYEKSFSGKELSIYVIVAKKREEFINPFEK